jgi:hypothetical protein
MSETKKRYSFWDGRSIIQRRTHWKEKIFEGAAAADAADQSP